MNQNQQGSTFNNSNPKIGGWLIVPAFGLILSAIFVLISISTEIIPVFTAVPFSDLSGQLRIYLVVDVVLNALLLIFIIVVAVLFFKRRRIVPKLMISLYFINLLFVLGDHFLFMSLNEVQWIFGVIQGVAACLVWIPYFLVSKRVKTTFVV